MPLKLFDFLCDTAAGGNVARLIHLVMAKPARLVHSAHSRGPSAEPFDAQGEEKPLPWVEGWRCAYDMKTGQFSIPADLADTMPRWSSYRTGALNKRPESDRYGLSLSIRNGRKTLA